MCTRTGTLSGRGAVVGAMKVVNIWTRRKPSLCWGCPMLFLFTTLVSFKYTLVYIYVCVCVCRMKAFPQYFDDKTNLAIVELSKRKHTHWT